MSAPPICQVCKQPVVWAVTEKGKRQALNPVPDPGGNTLAYRDGTATWRARSVASAGDGPRHVLEKVHMPHAATCAGPKQPPLPRTRPGRRTPNRKASAARLPSNVISITAARTRRNR